MRESATCGNTGGSICTARSERGLKKFGFEGGRREKGGGGGGGGGGARFVTNPLRQGMRKPSCQSWKPFKKKKPVRFSLFFWSCPQKLFRKYCCILICLPLLFFLMQFANATYGFLVFISFCSTAPLKFELCGMRRRRHSSLFLLF